MKTEEVIQSKKVQHTTPVSPIIAHRFSPRVFSSEEIPQEHIESFFEAAKWSPSSSNRQPWHFIWAKRNSEGFTKILSCLDEENAIWAQEVPLLIVGCYIERGDKGEFPYAKYDLGQAVMSIVIQARSLDYYTRQMGGFDKEKITQVLDIQSPTKPWVVVAVGKIGDYEQAPSVLLEKDQRPRARKENIATQI